MKYSIYKRNAGLNSTDRVVNLSAVQNLSVKKYTDKRTAQLILNALCQEVGEGVYYIKEVS